MIDWPETLVTNLARRRGILMIGSGVSRHSKGVNGEIPPTWRGFLDDALSNLSPRPNHIRKALKSGNYLDACDWLKSALDDRWATLMRQNFQAPQYTAATIHEILYNIDCRIVLTPNFDRIYDLYAEQKSQGTTYIKAHTDADILDHIRHGDRVVIKAHGTIEHPTHMIFTRTQYAEARTKYYDFYRLLESLIMTNSVLMIGVGVDDPDFQLLFEDTAARFQAGLPHYMTFAGIPHNDFARTIRETRNIKLLPYSPKDNHESLVKSLETLLAKVIEKREEIARTADW